MKFNVKQIYHTSHCGSTLMASLLKDCGLPVYTEPSWTHDMIQERGPRVFNKEMKEYDNSIIKFPSAMCNFSDHFYGEKVFLYRKLNAHLLKRKSINGQIERVISLFYKHNVKYCHPSLKEIEFDTNIKKIIFMWANRIQWLRDAKDILWIESNSFFLDKKKTMDLVCEHLKLPQVTDYSLCRIYVKGIGMNNSDIELSKVIPDISKGFVTWPSYGIVEDDLCLLDKEVVNSIEWTLDNIPFIPSKYIH